MKIRLFSEFSVAIFSARRKWRSVRKILSKVNVSPVPNLSKPDLPAGEVHAGMGCREPGTVPAGVSGFRGTVYRERATRESCEGRLPLGPRLREACEDRGSYRIEDLRDFVGTGETQKPEQGWGEPARLGLRSHPCGGNTGIVTPRQWSVGRGIVQMRNCEILRCDYQVS